MYSRENRQGLRPPVPLPPRSKPCQRPFRSLLLSLPSAMSNLGGSCEGEPHLHGTSSHARVETRDFSAFAQPPRGPDAREDPARPAPGISGYDATEVSG